MMSIDAKVKELRELRRMADELQTEIEAIQDAIKAEMDVRSVDALSGSDWTVTWKPVTTNRLDAAALKKALPDVAQRFVKQATVRRFVLA